MSLLAGTVVGQGTLNCGKYPTTIDGHGNTFCHRVALLPWFAGVPGAWETELRLGVTGEPVTFSLVSSLSLTAYTINLVLEDSDFGSTYFEAFDGLKLTKYGSHWTRILGRCADIGPCGVQSATGALLVATDGSSAAAVEAVSAFGVYTHVANGSVVSQSTAPLIFMDQAATRWSAVILETPRDLQSQSGATVTSFAVANLSADPQAVLVRVYDERGNLAGSAKTPVLDRGLGFNASDLVGGIYANTLSSVLGTNLPSNDCYKCQSSAVFRGTVVFEGENGGKIAPVVFRFDGSAMTTVPVRAE